MTEKILTKFKNGLAIYGLDIDDVVNNWKYAGGDEGRHLNYWHLLQKKHPFLMPAKQQQCICSTHIKEQCFIANPDFTQLLVVGNCCIKKFLKDSGRTCEHCKKAHKNRLYNRCNDCKNLCNECNIVSINSKYTTTCYSCKCKKNKKCIECNKPVNGFLRCFNCNNNKKSLTIGAF
jgi:hypothetical protein